MLKLPVSKVEPVIPARLLLAADAAIDIIPRDHLVFQRLALL